MSGADSGQARQRCEKWGETVILACFRMLFRFGMVREGLRDVFGRHRDNGRFPCSSG
ncbi:hypothetical protein GSP01_09040 [Gluconobacter sphaericus NBRC 12467]|nr:hypothetical protein GSP01_09040 [Gluconobacter sphaericus NBRC 12467]